jgi:quinoprotein glucose dehydrogenase
MKRDDADQLLRPLMDALHAHLADAALILDLCEAAEVRAAVPEFQAALEAHKSSRPAADPLAEYLECEVGGDADAGRGVFLHKDAVGCTRCHAVLDVMPRDASVLAGPDLNAVGLRLERRALLESVVEPNRVLAAGYETVYVESYDGESWRGRVVGENDQHLKLMSPVDGAVREVEIAKDNIDRRVPDISGMPTGIAGSLTKRELRDLIAFLSSCREERNVPAPEGTTDR